MYLGPEEHNHKNMNSFMRPLLEYADNVWDNCTQYESNDIDAVQNKVAGTSLVQPSEPPLTLKAPRKNESENVFC